MRILIILTLLILGGACDAHAEPGRIAFGINTSQQQTSYDEIRSIWLAAERLGYDSAWTFDHLLPSMVDESEPCLESWTMLSALAAETSRIRIGTLVTGNGFRNPALLAKMATTVDHISNGRLTLGLGAGWHEREFVAYGFPFPDGQERAARLGESLQVITKLWREERPTFRGRFYSLDEAPFAPKPVQRPHPPILVGGHGRTRIMPLVGRYAQAWNAPLGLSPDDIRDRVGVIHAECERVGRKPCDVEITALFVLYSMPGIEPKGPVLRLGDMLNSDEVKPSVLAGTPDAMVEKLRPYVDAGVTHFILNIQPTYSEDLLKRFAEEVIPRLQPR